MRFTPLALLLAALLAGAPPAQARVVLVGLDGASWNVIEPLLAAGELPAFANLLARGASAELATVRPVVSPVVWTSIATGRRPEAHGVTSFLATRLSLRVPTAFERLSAAGLRVGLYEWLVTWPPPALAGGFVVPAWMRRDETVFPADVWTRAGTLPFRVTYDGVVSREAHEAGIRAELAQKPRAWLALARAFELDVGATIFYAPDRTGHRFWRDAYPAGAAGGVPRAGSLLRETMNGVDRALGQIAASLAPDDVLLVASDHGFQAADEERHVWVGRTREHLARAGLDPARDGIAFMREFSILVARVQPGPFEAREAVTEKLAAFFASARGPEGEPLLRVQVVDGAPRPPGRERGFVERVRQAGFRLAAGWIFGERFAERAHAFVVARFDEEAMERLYPDATVSLGGRPLRADALAFREEFDGEHHPTAIFLAAGGPIRARATRARLSVLDVAPLLFYLAGQPIPDDLEGALPRDWINSAHLAAHPPRSVPAAEAPRLAPSQGAPSPEVGDAEMQERLRSLGYIE